MTMCAQIYIYIDIISDTTFGVRVLTSGEITSYSDELSLLHTHKIRQWPLLLAI